MQVDEYDLIGNCLYIYAYMYIDSYIFRRRFVLSLGQRPDHEVQLRSGPIFMAALLARQLGFALAGLEDEARC